jgi:hypothetical protein
MKSMMVRYRIKPELAAENQRLIEAVFQELRAEAPDDVRYLALRLGDDSFVHLVQGKTQLIPALAAFKPFSGGIVERCVDAPRQSDAAVIGNYRMLAE